jgi:DNA-binding NarL/FixJ family response regulator
MPGKLRVVLIDSNDEVRAALTARLGAEPGFEVVGETADGQAGQKLVAALHPDVAVVDPKRSDGRGLEIISGITHSQPSTPVVALTSYVNDWEQWAVCRAGARGYFLKDIGLGGLAAQIRLAAAQGT